MTKEARTVQELFAEQFRVTARISTLTGEYHRLLQKVGAAAFARQMAEDQPGGDLAGAERAEIAAKLTAEACETQIQALEQRLSALGQDLATLK